MRSSQWGKSKFSWLPQSDPNLWSKPQNLQMHFNTWIYICKWLTKRTKLNFKPSQPLLIAHGHWHERSSKKKREKKGLLRETNEAVRYPMGQDPFHSPRPLPHSIATVVHLFLPSASHHPTSSSAAVRNCLPPLPFPHEPHPSPFSPSLARCHTAMHCARVPRMAPIYSNGKCSSPHVWRSTATEHRQSLNPKNHKTIPTFERSWPHQRVVWLSREES